MHFVVPEMDSGPIIVQGAVAVQPDDTEEALAKRVLAVEHRIYPQALRLVAEGRVRVADGRCLIRRCSGVRTRLLLFLANDVLAPNKQPPPVL